MAKLLPRSGSNSETYNLNAIELLLSLVGSISQTPENVKREFLSLVGSIFRSPTNVLVLMKFIELRATTSYFLRTELKISETSVHRSLKRLMDEGLICIAAPLRWAKKQGAPANIYAIKGYDPEEDILRAIERDRYARTPAYAEVRQFKQLILEEYIAGNPYITNKELKRREVLTFIKRRYRRGEFLAADITDLVCIELQRLGYKISRRVPQF